MTDDNQVLLLSVSGLVNVQSVDGGDTLAIRFLDASGQELVLIAPRQVASALQAEVEMILSQPQNRTL
nr:hypothetical protein NG677_01300 [Methylobacterium sp. OTU13CASTA1]